MFEAYNVTIRLGIMYINKAEYSDLLFFSKCKRIFIKNSP